MVSGVSAHFISRGINCPFVPDYLFKDVCTASSLGGQRELSLLCLQPAVNNLGSLSLTFLSCGASPLQAQHPPGPLRVATGSWGQGIC